MSAGPVEVYQVGEILADELDARGWTQVDFAEIIGRPAQFVSEIIAGKKEITRESAAQIAAALGTTTEMWLNLQDAYHLWRQSQDSRAQEALNDVRRRSQLKDLAPISLLKKRGFITSDSLTGQEEEVKRLYGIDDLGVVPEILVATRRSTNDSNLSSTQAAWIVCVRRRAEAMKSEPFDNAALGTLASRLTRELSRPDDFIGLPARFAEVGVRLVYVEAFPSSKMDGCSFGLDSGEVVIGISGRGKRLDKVLFTLLHEVAHVLLGHLDQQPYIIDDEVRPTLGLEGEANELAASWVLPRPLPPIPESIRGGWISSVAEQQEIHPIVLIGHLQHKEVIEWRSTLVRNAPTVTEQLERW